ncbi:two-component response regulator [Caldovatus sediminis]|uniref:Two-component response regulator n=1 Tax=Caldovatus sediminis TaxID=2041189 RepID=A0A8J2ZCG3_9PROT|nr:response regulator [Caldovatus sediminis]GGG37301.1 two-component response regulator [Caldovatus sediminis]
MSATGAEPRAALIRSLPYARRFARALVGGQRDGDALVARALREVLDAAASRGGDGRATAELAVDATARIALYRAVGRLVPDAPGAADGGLPVLQRKLLLLTALEELDIEDAAAAADLDPERASQELARARETLRSRATERVLIIEDEPIIAMDIQALVEGCGHTVVGIAGSEEEAVAIAEVEKPGLVLADINLGAGGDGTAAVARILERHRAPVIFVTAYPERLLTGEAVEPAFVITKPFDPTTLAIATYQAVTRGMRLR